MLSRKQVAIHLPSCHISTFCYKELNLQISALLCSRSEKQNGKDYQPQKICVQTQIQLTQPKPSDAVAESLNATLKRNEYSLLPSDEPSCQMPGNADKTPAVKKLELKAPGQKRKEGGTREFCLCQPFFVHRENPVNDY